MAFIELTTTFETKEDAQTFSRKIVEERLAACAQIKGPVTSVYIWENEVKEEEEWVVSFKTKKVLHDKIEAFFKANHPYKTPQITTHAFKASEAYQNWIQANLE